jgi:hypothetical protein
MHSVTWQKPIKDVTLIEHSSDFLLLLAHAQIQLYSQIDARTRTTRDRCFSAIGKPYEFDTTAKPKPQPQPQRPKSLSEKVYKFLFGKEVFEA